MKSVLTIINIAGDPTGYVGEILEAYDIPFDVVDASKDTIPDPTQYEAMVVFGGPQNANEDEKYPYFLQEKAAIRAAIEKSIPILGICLGGQILATVLGGEVKKHTLTEIGYSDVQCTDEGKRDPLFAGFEGRQLVYQWHEDTFSIPPGAVRLATSDKTENQAFRFGQNAYGIQYHIELTPPMLNNWLHEPDLKQEIVAAIGESEYERVMNERATFEERYKENTCIMFENFLRVAKIL